MKETFKIVGVLTGVCVLCAFFLSFVYGTAQLKIEENKKKGIEHAISKLMPETKAEKMEIENEEIYELSDKRNNLLGYAFIAQGQGYQGKIKMLAVINSSLEKLEGIEVLESIETPGLGAKIQEAEFKNQFKNLKVSVPIEYVKGYPEKDNQIVAITGATVSSRSVTNILNKKIETLKKILGKK